MKALVVLTRQRKSKMKKNKKKGDLSKKNFGGPFYLGLTTVLLTILNYKKFKTISTIEIIELICLFLIPIIWAGIIAFKSNDANCFFCSSSRTKKK